MKDCVLAMRDHPWLFDVLEILLSRLSDASTLDGHRLLRGQRSASGRPVTDSEALLALNALCDLGVATRNGPRYRIDPARWRDSKPTREGIKAAIEALGSDNSAPSHNAHLCVALPPGLSPAAEHVIRESSTDLRSGLLDVIAGARLSLLIASPFWDAGTTREIVAFAKKKLEIGVTVTILGRFSEDLPAAVRSELRKISADPNCSILSWFEAAGPDVQTFHFKAISADRGTKAYLGSANMTVSSLRSRMELGVALTGSVAEELDRVLRVVLTLAAPAAI